MKMPVFTSLAHHLCHADTQQEEQTELQRNVQRKRSEGLSSMAVMVVFGILGSSPNFKVI